MAKVSFTKLGLKISQEIKTLEFNEQDIEIKQYLPINEKLELMSNVINSAADGNNFANPVKTKMFMMLEIMYYYTNINFTDKQKEDPAKLYDALLSSGLMVKILDLIPADEYKAIKSGVEESTSAVYAYQNSILGILDTVTQDYSNLDLDASEIQQKIADPKNMALLKDVLTKLG